MMSFSQRLKELRKEKGLTQQGLADKLNKSKSTISSYESNRRTPDINVVRDIAEFFNVSADYLIGKSEIRNSNDKIKQALEDNPELSDFWDQVSNRESMKVLFKQTRNMSDEAIEDVVRFMKSVEKEIEENR